CSAAILPRLRAVARGAALEQAMREMAASVPNGAFDRPPRGGAAESSRPFEAPIDTCPRGDLSEMSASAQLLAHATDWSTRGDSARAGSLVTGSNRGPD